MGYDHKTKRIETFEDSLIYNSEFRIKTLGSKFTRFELDSAISNNKEEAQETIMEIEILYEDRIRLGRNYTIYQVIDQLLNLLTVVSGGLLIYFWIKSRK
ncbi:hypothetical protein BGP76_19170 [Reichenbachiella sp. MSK19-1]|nr:hypothetical protein BGP76_19170 [Reichenbachiella sp. MSK19-1]